MNNLNLESNSVQSFFYVFRKSLHCIKNYIFVIKEVFENRYAFKWNIPIKNLNSITLLHFYVLFYDWVDSELKTWIQSPPKYFQLFIEVNIHKVCANKLFERWRKLMSFSFNLHCKKNISLIIHKWILNGLFSNLNLPLKIAV